MNKILLYNFSGVVSQKSNTESFSGLFSWIEIVSKGGLCTSDLFLFTKIIEHTFLQMKYVEKVEL